MHGIMADGYWPDGNARSWRTIKVLSRNGRFCEIKYCDTGETKTVAAAAIYSGDAPIGHSHQLDTSKLRRK